MKCIKLETGDWFASLGERMDPHVEECPDCRTRYSEYMQLAAMLAEESPRPLPSAWKEGVFARLQAAEVRARHRRRLIAGGLSIAAVAAAVALIQHVKHRPVAVNDMPALAMTIDHPAHEGWRSGPETAHVGDTVRAEVKGGSIGQFELRIYRDRRELLVRCPGDAAPGCKRSGSTLAVLHTMDGMGDYQVVWLISSSLVPAPSGDFESDLAALRDRARIEDIKQISVQ